MAAQFISKNARVGRKRLVARTGVLCAAAEESSVAPPTALYFTAGRRGWLSLFWDCDTPWGTVPALLRPEAPPQDSEEPLTSRGLLSRPVFIPRVQLCFLPLM
ncbi:hypothetical protein MRX96_006956 [Rhipicephalus microplus]